MQSELTPPLSPTRRQSDSRPAVHGIRTALERRSERARKWIDRCDVPVLVRMEDRLVLVLGDQRREFEASGRRLDRLSDLCQMSTQLVMGVLQADGRSIDSVVSTFRKRVRALPEGLCARSTSAIRTASYRLLEHALAHPGQVGETEVLEYHATLRPALDRLVRLTTQLESIELQSAIRQMEATLPPVPWNRAVCVNCVERRAGYRHLIDQAMESWLDRYAHPARPGADRVLRLAGRKGLDHAMDLAAAHVNGRKAALAADLENMESVPPKPAGVRPLRRVSKAGATVTPLPVKTT